MIDFRLFVIAALVPLAGACATGLNCDPDHDAVYGVFRGTFARNGDQRVVEWIAIAAEDWLYPEGHDELVAVLFRGAGTPGVFRITFEGFDATVPTPLVRGASFPIGWTVRHGRGFSAGATDTHLRVGIMEAAFSSTVPVPMTGTAQVAGQPGEVVIELNARSDSALSFSYSVVGTMTFWRGEAQGACYSS